jgi:superfamily II DNA/RNA helicase
MYLLSSPAISLDAEPSFADLGIPSKMAQALAARGLTSPFPIQAATIPEALDGRDICGRAPTGSGKTIAFGIPLVLGIGKAQPRKPRGLVLVPTRELAAQVSKELQLLAKPKGPWVESFYGGVGFDRQVSALRRGVDIAVACPGRLADLVNQRQVDLGDVDFVVIDEADRMADMGFLPEVRRLLDQCSTKRQTLLFSATLDGDVDVLIKNYQHNPARHEFFQDNEGGEKSTHLFWAVDRTDKLRVTADVIRRLGPTVVFCRTKRGADRVARQLESAGVRAAAIHGNRSQGQRDRALQSFHRGQVEALVATDVAARGIHVDDVACVIHFDPPEDDKTYVHRSGRTARAGAEGVVVSLVPNELKRDVAKIQRDLGRPSGLTKVDLGALGTPGAAAPTTDRPKLHAVETDDRVPAYRAKVARPDREPLPAGKRRPSGAARRKAKRQNDWATGRVSDGPRKPSGKASSNANGNGNSNRRRSSGKPRPNGGRGKPSRSR